MAARTAMAAVVASRVSPTMMMSGSCRMSERRPTSKVRPAVSLTCTCVMRGMFFSTGSSMVEMLTSSLLSACRTM